MAGGDERYPDTDTPKSIGKWQNFTPCVTTKDPPVQIAKIQGKDFGLVATRDVKKGEVVFTEEAALGAVIPMPLREGSPPSHCTTCYKCMEPADAFFDEALPIPHLWANRSFPTDWVAAIAASNDDNVEKEKYLNDEQNGRILCQNCKSMFCGRDCQLHFQSKIFADCCRYQKLLDELADIAFHHDNTKTLADYWEVLLATRLFCRLLSKEDQSSLLLSDAMKGLCGEADQLSPLEVGLCLDDTTYTVDPFYNAICKSLSLNETETEASSTEFFQRLVVVCKRNALDIQPTFLFSSYETALVKNCQESGADSSEVIGKVARIVGKQMSSTATASLDPHQFGTVHCCAVLPLFARLNHSCDPNLEIKDLGPLPVVQLIATRDIRQGEELSICYLSEESIQRDECQRNERLQSRYLFTCQCPRCLQERPSQE